jgi:hypothetical protein
VAQATLIPLGPIIVGATLALLLGRASRECGTASQRQTAREAVK